MDAEHVFRRKTLFHFDVIECCNTAWVDDGRNETPASSWMEVADRPGVFRSTWVWICVISLQHICDCHYGIFACVRTGGRRLGSQMSWVFHCVPQGSSVWMISTRVVLDDLAGMVLSSAVTDTEGEGHVSVFSRYSTAETCPTAIRREYAQ